MPSHRMSADQLTALSFKLADDYAAVSFNSNCYPRGDGWYAIPPRSERDGHLNDVMRYLRARKMLEGRRGGAKLWRVVNEPA